MWKCEIWFDGRSFRGVEIYEVLWEVVRFTSTTVTKAFCNYQLSFIRVVLLHTLILLLGYSFRCALVHSFISLK